VNALDASAARGWVDAFLASAEADVERLGDLDRESGDGDFGTNLVTSIRSARGRLSAETDDTPDAGGSFRALSTAFLGTGGTSGPLFGMWFRELARAGEGAPAYSVTTLAAGVRAGLDTVRRLGGADVGDKTMIDAIAPAADALDAAASAGSDLRQALGDAARAAQAGAEATAALAARRGRASWVGEAARGVVDPGAATVALFFAAGDQVGSSK
jgi:phosphoenolpyruvate---glycerone phosphotransferase subunit DhaL